MKTPDPREPGRHRPAPPGVSPGDGRLRHPSDRLRRWVDLLLLVVMVVCVPIAGAVTGTLAYEHAQHAAQTKSSGDRQITARLTANASVLVPGADTGSATADAPVRWNDKGKTHTGRAMVAVGQHKGTSVRIWVDRDGRITVPPADSTASLTAGVAVGFTAAGAAAVLGCGTLAGFHRSLDRRNHARWEREWALVEPRWSHCDSG
ncbi:hypothetical protein ACFYYH_22990 [Streptomyces sp. NPDC002018]|uniref:Rv1733c family protein n=1 Tax=Streptomyces sp. NPDC002018 TaxID=3364629 RepID=UPI00368CE821